MLAHGIVCKSSNGYINFFVVHLKNRCSFILCVFFKFFAAFKFFLKNTERILRSQNNYASTIRNKNELGQQQQNNYYFA